MARASGAGEVTASARALALAPAVLDRRHCLRAALGAFTAMGLAACSSPAPTTRGQVQGAKADAKEFAQSDTNRMATLAMTANLESLMLLLEKLYRRNPAEWRKTSNVGREDAQQIVEKSIRQREPWPALGQRRDIVALAYALSPEFQGDRPAAFIYAMGDMIVTANGGKLEFFLVDGQDAQHLYNAARNVETAAWLLAQRRNAAGQPLLYADEISLSERNLSFEREFGKIIARLDLMAQLMDEKYRRAVIDYAQSFFGGMFLQFLPVR